MTGDGESPKNEFANFLDDIAEEISQRVESIATPTAHPLKQGAGVDEESRVLDWPGVVDRMIDEIR